MKEFSVVEKDTGQVLAYVWEENGDVKGICQDDVLVNVDGDVLITDDNEEDDFINDILDEIIERLERAEI